MSNVSQKTDINQAQGNTVPNNIVVKNVALNNIYPMMVRGMVLCEF